MSLDDYLNKRRFNQIKKDIRRKKPYLMGEQLDQEVERVLGIADSGAMDWVTYVESGKGTSKHPTPESIGYDECVTVAQEHNMRPYQLYWFFYKAVERLKSAGRSKTDYYAYLKHIAAKSVSKKLTDDEKVLAAMLWSKVGGEEISKAKAEIMLETGVL